MAFKAKVISDEVKTDINSNIELGIDNGIELMQKKTVEAGDSNRQKAKAPDKAKKKTPKQINWDELVHNSSLNYSKWQEYKKTLLVKPIEQLDEEWMNVALPAQLVQKLNQLGLWHKSIHNKTIVSNLLVKFFIDYKEIIDFVEEEYNKANR